MAVGLREVAEFYVGSVYRRSACERDERSPAKTMVQKFKLENPTTPAGNEVIDAARTAEDTPCGTDQTIDIVDGGKQQLRGTAHGPARDHKDSYCMPESDLSFLPRGCRKARR